MGKKKIDGEKLKVVARLKDEDEIIEVTAEDRNKINRTIMKLRALSNLISHYEWEEGAIEQDFGAAEWIFEDLINEIYIPLCKYGLAN